MCRSQKKIQYGKDFVSQKRGIEMLSWRSVCKQTHANSGIESGVTDSTQVTETVPRGGGKRSNIVSHTNKRPVVKMKETNGTLVSGVNSWQV